MESYIEKYGNENHVEVKITSYGSGSQLLLNYQKRKFDVIFLDVSMPEMDGFEVLAYINKYHWNDTFAVIMISADDSPANIKRAYDLGAFDYISRPFDSTFTV